MKLWIVVLFLALIVLYATTMEKQEVENMNPLTLSSPAFRHGEAVPARHTCDGHDSSPPLLIANVPARTRSLALIMDDPDAPSGTWVHWLVWNLPAATREIAENGLPREAVQGRNSWRRNGYGGPCPPSGSHRYVFRLFALDVTLRLGAAADRSELEQVMSGHILAHTELMGTYQRH
ncbi:YbhB/YbcL family Raf kinase inhibitor-like protein [Trichlorobacter ammonificans]|uniref:Phospholipid-binding protein, PBP family n=1 Tax=Trichlorobacter ammonificans TaxID=2916410 RepID=A0ABM9DAG7_9BACT|nr:YbhB/YbcL family Raf kinase inhibitor-like protein [Trichlorobacter ammonificans]CAH2031378.1 Phospholipid-binding protein, PBP family [Trichlorobacter ammonificans]